MFWSANSSLYLYGTPTVGACQCIDAHGSQEQRVSTCLSFTPPVDCAGLDGPHAGTDLGIMRTKAEAQSDGSYAITGRKFSSPVVTRYGGNIVHLTLARPPDAPLGSKGIFIYRRNSCPMRTDRSASAMVGRAVHLNTRWVSTAAPPVINYDSA